MFRHVRHDRISCVAILLLCLVGLAGVAADPPAAPTSAPAASSPPAAPTTASEDAWQPPTGLPQGWYASIETTMGTVVARLLPEQAPQSVAHFVGLAQGTLPWLDVTTGETISAPYYDGMPIETVMAGKFFESGDGAALGRGTPMMFVPEHEGAGPVNFNQPYMLGLTRLAGARISAAKFFVTVAAQPWLNGESPCFGSVMDGRETIFNISQVKAYSSHRPIDEVRIEHIRIFAVGDPPALPEPEPYQPQRKEIEFDADRQSTPYR